jgi:hypothetical protein
MSEKWMSGCGGTVRVTYGTDFLVFKVAKSGDRWLVKDIDVTTEKAALELVKKFKTKYPTASVVPARADGLKGDANTENKLIGTWKGWHRPHPGVYAAIARFFVPRGCPLTSSGRD